MAVSNRERVGRAFEALAKGLGPFVDDQMRAVHGAGWLEAFSSSGQRGPQPASLGDPAFLLRVVAEAWESAFRHRLARPERSLVFELRDTRNRWAHNEAFNADDTYRALDSIERLLVAADAKEAEEVGRSKAELMRLRYEAEAKKAASGLVTSAAGAGLRPWREVIVPHDDVAQGRYELAEFAADLHQVASGEGSAEYADAVEFFRRTYLTEGLRQLLTEALRRLSGAGGVPVVDLQTTFGGGKTHSLIALWHLCSSTPIEQFPQEVQDLLREAGVSRPEAIRRAALVGTRIAPGQVSTKPDGTQVATLWGELAWQLAGRHGYELVAEADRTGTSPAGALAELFQACAPCLVLVDEWVAYARQLYATEKRLCGGSFEAHVSFAQALCEATRSTDGALLVVSLPASVAADASPGPGSASSSVELGGPGGAEALRRLRAVVGRMESSWRPASAEEGFEIVRRRLFKPIDPSALVYRDATARAFAELYRKQAAEFPAECREPAYERRLRAAYPIHPELFDRLYEDWSTLERFQRTRGVLRLMAQVVGALWRSGDRSPLILPATVPLDDAPVASELARNLEDSWKPVMDADVDGPASLPARLDATNPNLGRYGATRKVARTVFLGSAPTVHSAHRGIEAARVRLGCAAPGEPVATYGDALSRLSDQATYLYVDRDRYWYGLSPSVSRIARDRAERWLASGTEELDREIAERIRRQRDRGELAGVHVAPSSPADVDDEDGVRLVMLSPSQAHLAKSEDSPALAAAREILEQRGNAPRLNRNMVVFLAADDRRVEDLRQGMAEALAWGSIVAEADELDLVAQQAAQARSKADEAENTVARRLAEAYMWALVPTQPDPTGPLVFEAVRVDGPGDLAARTSRRLIDKGHLYLVYAPSLLRRMVLDGPLSPLWSSGHTSVADLWEALARYPYLPRLKDRSVLERSVAEGPGGFSWQEEGFALADGVDPATGRYLGLVVGPGGVASVSASTLIVRPEIAQVQVEAEQPSPAETGSGRDEGDRLAGTVGAGAVSGVGGGPRPVPAKPRRFHGSLRLRADRPILEFGKVVEEVLSHLTDSADEVELTVEISARAEDGFEEGVVRTVTENARTLHFGDAGFEED
jgi:predicted AAA+ superfamily ATPase